MSTVERIEKLDFQVATTGKCAHPVVSTGSQKTPASRQTIESALNGYLSAVARRNAAAASDNPEASSGCEPSHRGSHRLRNKPVQLGSVRDEVPEVPPSSARCAIGPSMARNFALARPGCRTRDILKG